MTDKERLTDIVAIAIAEPRLGSVSAWDRLPDADRNGYRRHAESVIKALQVHGYLNSRGYPPEELKKYGITP